MVVTTSWYLALGAVLFSIGAEAHEGQVDGVEHQLDAHEHDQRVTAGQQTDGAELGDLGGQLSVFFVLVVAAAEVVVGLGIIVAIMRRRQGATADDLSVLGG